MVLAQAAACRRGLPHRGGARSQAEKTAITRADSAPAKGRAPQGAVLKGRAIADAPVPVGELLEDSGIIVVQGEIIGVNEPRELKGGETVLVSFALGDDTSTICAKLSITIA